MTFTCILGWIYYAITFGCQPSRYDCDDDVLNEKGAISFFVDRHAQGYGLTHCSCSLNRIDKTAGPRRRLKRKPSGWLKRQRKKLPSISLRSLSSHYPKSPLTRSVYWMLLYHVNCASGSHNLICYCSFMNWLTTALNLPWLEGSPTICSQRLPKEVRALSSVGNYSFLDDFHLITFNLTYVTST